MRYPAPSLLPGTTLLLCLFGFLDALPLQANTGVVNSLVSQGGDLLSPVEQPDVQIARELIHLDMGYEGHLSAVAQWSVQYHFDNSAPLPQSVDVVFPIELTFAGKEWTQSYVEQFLWSEMANFSGKASLQDVCSAAGEADGLIMRLANSRSRLELPFSTSNLANMLAFDVRQDGGRIAPQSIILQFEPVDRSTLEAQLKRERLRGRHYIAYDPLLGAKSRSGARPIGPESWTLTRLWERFWSKKSAGTAATGTRVTVYFRFPLHFPAQKGSSVTVRYRTPLTMSGDPFTIGYSTSYLLGSGRNWKGPIGDVWLAIADRALQGDGMPSVPFARDPFAWNKHLVWHASNYEPGPSDRIVVGGISDQSMGNFLRGSSLNEREIAAMASISGSQHQLKIDRRNPLATLPSSACGLAHAWSGWLDPIAPRLVPGAPSASSVWAEPDEYVYVYSDSGPRPRQLLHEPAQAFDGEVMTAWCGGGKEQNVDEWLEFSLSAPVQGLDIFPGNQRRGEAIPCQKKDVELTQDGRPLCGEHCYRYAPEELFNRFGAPSQIDVVRSDGALIAGVSLNLTPGQATRVDTPLEPGRYRLRIRAERAGKEKGKGSVCIAEVVPRVTAHPWLAEGMGRVKATSWEKVRETMFSPGDSKEAYAIQERAAWSRLCPP